MARFEPRYCPDGHPHRGQLVRRTGGRKRRPRSRLPPGRYPRLHSEDIVLDALALTGLDDRLVPDPPVPRPRTFPIRSARSRTRSGSYFRRRLDPPGNPAWVEDPTERPGTSTGTAADDSPRRPPPPMNAHSLASLAFQAPPLGSVDGRSVICLPTASRCGARLRDDRARPGQGRRPPRRGRRRADGFRARGGSETRFESLVNP